MLSPFPPDFGGGGSSATVLDHFVNFAHGMVIGILIGIAATAALLDFFWVGNRWRWSLVLDHFVYFAHGVLFDTKYDVQQSLPP